MPANPAPWWHPGKMARRLPALQARARIVQAVEQWFLAQDFLKVETPALQISPGLEPGLTAFATRLERPGEADLPLFLHTSPEFAMKKLLAAGLARIFQMARVYRNAERSDIHHPEFTMLEWYRAGQDWRALMADVKGLLQAALTAAGAEAFQFHGLSSDPFRPWQEITVAQAFATYAGIDLMALLGDPLNPDVAGFRQAAEAAGVRVDEGDDWDDAFFKVFMARIEPHLGHPAPTLLTEYPVCMAALSRPKPEDGRVAERFELYVCGLELANAFGELTDAAEQRRRFDADRARREERLGFSYPIDEDFLAALEHGLPDCAGIALGVDRLVMLAVGAQRIDDVLWAPVAG